MVEYWFLHGLAKEYRALAMREAEEPRPFGSATKGKAYPAVLGAGDLWSCPCAPVSQSPGFGARSPSARIASVFNAGTRLNHASL